MHVNRDVFSEAFALVIGLALWGAVWGAVSAGPPAGESLADRRARLESMSSAERDRLLRSQQRFEQLSESERQRLRKLHADLERDPDAEQLRLVMDRYQEWLKSLPASQRAELPKLSNEERIERIKRWQAEENRRAGRRLSRSDVQAMLQWIGDHALVTISEAERKRYTETVDPQQRSELVREHLDDARVRGALRPARPEEIEDLKGRLSAEAQQLLTEAQTAGRDELRKLMYFWFAQCRGAFDDRQAPDITHENLARYFDTLSERDRDELLALPPDEMWQRLARRYLREGGGSSFPGRRPSGQRPERSDRPERRGNEERGGERSGDRNGERPGQRAGDRPPPPVSAGDTPSAPGS